MTDERQALQAVLTAQRERVHAKLRGCDDDRLRASTTPGGLTAHGIVKHLTNVERFWFREVLLGEQDLVFDWRDDEPDLEFVAPEPIDELLDAYAAECARCDAAAATRRLDDLAVNEFPPDPGPKSLRWVYLHVIPETARHLGHLDLLREQADGGVGFRPEPAR